MSAAFEVLVTLAGIAGPALIVTAAVRRWLQPVSWRVALLLWSLAVAWIARGVFTPDVPVPLDEVARGYPYRGLFGDVKSKNYLANDTVKQILPWMMTAREQLFAGQAPLWNPYAFSGYPLLGNGQSAPFSPFFIATLFVPLPKQIVAMAGLKLYVALLFGFLFIRREGANDAAALMGSGVFAFAIFNNCFLYYPMTAVTLLLPAAACCALMCLREKTRAPFVAIAVVVAALLAGGHPESVVHVVIAVLLLLAIEFASPQWGTGRPALNDLGRVAAAGALGVFLAAPAWVPVLEQVLASVRLVEVQHAGPARSVAAVLWGIINPDGFGNPAHGNWSWFGNYTHVASLYLGLLVTALLPAALLSRASSFRDRLLFCAAAVSFVISMGWTPLTTLFYAVPPLSWIAHDRLRFVVCFIAGVIAARVITRLHREDILWTAVSSVVLAVLGVDVYVKLLNRTLLWWSIAGVALLMLFWAAAILFRRTPAMVATVACVVALTDLFVFGFDYNAITPRRYYVPRLEIIDALKRSAPSEPFRVLGLDWVLLPNGAAQYHLEDVRGSDPMEWSPYALFFQSAEVSDPSTDVKRIGDPTRPLIDFLNVRYLFTEPGAGLAGKWHRLYSGAEGELYENRGVLSRFYAPAVARRVDGHTWQQEMKRIADYRDSVLVQGAGLPAVLANPPGVFVSTRQRGPARFDIEVRSPAPALIASSQPAIRWWRVVVNGKRQPPITVNGAFLGFRVAAGSSRVRVEYVPLSFYAAVVVAVAAAGMIAWRSVWMRLA